MLTGQWELELLMAGVRIADDYVRRSCTAVDERAGRCRFRHREDVHSHQFARRVQNFDDRGAGARLVPARLRSCTDGEVLPEVEYLSCRGTSFGFRRAPGRPDWSGWLDWSGRLGGF
jgi:hypothetical protein